MSTCPAFWTNFHKAREALDCATGYAPSWPTGAFTADSNGYGYPALPVGTSTVGPEGFIVSAPNEPLQFQLDGSTSAAYFVPYIAIYSSAIGVDQWPTNIIAGIPAQYVAKVGEGLEGNPAYPVAARTALADSLLGGASWPAGPLRNPPSAPIGWDEATDGMFAGDMQSAFFQFTSIQEFALSDGLGSPTLTGDYRLALIGLEYVAF